MSGIQLPQGNNATTGRQFTFNHSVLRSSSYSFDRHWKDEGLSRPWSQPLALNLGTLGFLRPNYEAIALATEISWTN